MRRARRVGRSRRSRRAGRRGRRRRPRRSAGTCPAPSEREDARDREAVDDREDEGAAVTATIAIRDPEVPPPSASTASIPTAAASVIALTLKNAFVQPRRVDELPEDEAERHRRDHCGCRLEKRERDDVRLLVGRRLTLSRRPARAACRRGARARSANATARTSAGRSTNGRTGDHEQQRDGGDGEQRGQREKARARRRKHPARAGLSSRRRNREGEAGVLLGDGRLKAGGSGRSRGAVDQSRTWPSERTWRGLGGRARRGGWGLGDARARGSGC